ncbi:penicillin acylase family protein [Pantoea ananatis]|uniref:penicillin acylase family protein n=2 Tax=Pantoea ananas TaxID=553 RepID=UPI000CF36F9C|nr:penicillin acylase family protein [Pantoea ananatis]PQK71584.1 hypothetical protein CG427_17240 [Pantoea ananatis]
MMSKSLFLSRRVIFALILSALLGLLIIMGVISLLAMSLPSLDGTKKVIGINKSVKIQRDIDGVPSISGSSREDVAYASGYIQAQERFFQMDLLRRSANGTLADLIGHSMVDIDRDHRIHLFSDAAHRDFINLPLYQRLILNSYTAGVNAGLEALKARPFEYFALGVKPKLWSPEDCLLVIYAMYFELQENQLHRKFAMDYIKNSTDANSLKILFPQFSHWDAPLDHPIIVTKDDDFISPPPSWLGYSLNKENANIPFGTGVGSSSWAISGKLTNNGSAIVANDMHLKLTLPNIWYRAVITYNLNNGVNRRIVGVMLPGTPVIVAGSNGKVAWGFTNSYGDDLDLVKLELNPFNKKLYKTPSGWQKINFRDEIIHVNHDKDEVLKVGSTQYGPLWIKGNNYYAIRWVAHDFGAVNLDLLNMESAETVSDALLIGANAGIPEQNFLVGDINGNIGWTIAGAMPKRITKFMDEFPHSSNDINIGWGKLLEANAHPALKNPISGLLWSANSRQLAGTDYSIIGDGGADLGARAQQIRNDLQQVKIFNEKSAFDISLDDRAVFMSTWRNIALNVLDESALKNHPARAEFKKLLINSWTGHASINSVGYRLSREFLFCLYGQLFGKIDYLLSNYDKKSSFAKANPRWPILIEKLIYQHPTGWLPNEYKSWRDVELSAIDKSIDNLSKNKGSLQNATWGARNTADIVHPLAKAFPFLSNFLSAPDDQLPGDGNMPRVSAPSFGQSERMVVSPGHENFSIFNMPGGESGNPLSSYFLSGHENWVKGLPTPLLPMTIKHTFVLSP